jgi:uncharacterized protein
MQGAANTPPPGASDRGGPTFGPAILVFVRAPELGRVKTRLAAGIGAERALAAYRFLGRSAVHAALAVGEGVEVRVLFTPPASRALVRHWLGPGPVLVPQADGDLGARLGAAFDQAFSGGHSPVLVIGSDIPDVDPPLIRRALAALGSAEAVIGPAADGGYYLLGLRSPTDSVFDRIEWSTDRVFSQTLERLAAQGVTPATLPVLRDVDTAADLPSELAARLFDD